MRLSYPLSHPPSRTNAECGGILPPQRKNLLCPERLTVGALVLSGVGLVGTHQDPVQRAVVLSVAVIGTGLDGAFDALVGMAVHTEFLLLFWYSLSMAAMQKRIQEKSVNIAFFGGLCYCDR